MRKHTGAGLEFSIMDGLHVYVGEAGGALLLCPKYDRVAAELNDQTGRTFCRICMAQVK